MLFLFAPRKIGTSYPKKTAGNENSPFPAWFPEDQLCIVVNYILSLLGLKCRVQLLTTGFNIKAYAVLRHRKKALRKISLN